MSFKGQSVEGPPKPNGIQQQIEPVAGPSTAPDLAVAGPSSSLRRSPRISAMRAAALLIPGPSREPNRSHVNGRGRRVSRAEKMLSSRDERRVRQQAIARLHKSFMMERNLRLKRQYLLLKRGFSCSVYRVSKKRRASVNGAAGNAARALSLSWENLFLIRGSIEEVMPAPVCALVDENNQGSRILRTFIGTPEKRNRTVRKSFFQRWASLKSLVQGSCMWNSLQVTDKMKDKVVRLMGIMTWTLDAMRSHKKYDSYIRNKNGRIASTFTLDSVPMCLALKQAALLRVYWKIGQEAMLLEPLYLILTIFGRPDGNEAGRDAHQLVDLRISLEKANHELKR